MPSCSAIGCRNRRYKGGVTFHRFPKRPELRKQWVAALERDDWEPKSNTHLCSQHFKEEDIDRTSVSCVRIRDSAVPTISLNVPAEKQKKRRPLRRKLVHIVDVESACPGNEDHSETSLKEVFQSELEQTKLCLSDYKQKEQELRHEVFIKSEEDFEICYDNPVDSLRDISEESNCSNGLTKHESPPQLSSKKRKSCRSPSPSSTIDHDAEFKPNPETVKPDTEFDIWARSIAFQLNNMEPKRALALQLKMQTLLTEDRIERE